MKAMLTHVSKQYQGVPVLRDVTLTLEGTTVLMAPSGRGKTTLARLLLGLEQPDEGRVECTGHLVAQFQEDRLCPQLSAVQNVALAAAQCSLDQIVQALQQLGLNQQDLHKQAAQLSGGQARRVALARALLAPGDGIILDEPFKGLDETTRQKAIRWVQDTLQGRWLLLITHDHQEAAAFGGVCLRWNP